MFTQKFIKIFHSVQEIGPFLLFQNLALGKASTDDKCHFAILWARSFQHQIVCKFYQNIPNGLIVNFHLFQNLNLGKTSTNPKSHLTISWATSCQYTNVYAQFHHNIPLSSRDLSQISFDNLIGYILSISMCMQNFITIFFTVLEMGSFSFFQNLELGKIQTDICMSYISVHARAALDFGKHVVLFKYYRSNKKWDI